VINIEPSWLTQALKGDDEAFTRIVEAYQTPVYNLCYRMLGDAYEAEDAAQETFLRAYGNLKRYDPERSFSTWLLSIAAHYCIDQVRKRRMKFLSLDDPDMSYLDPPDLGPGPEARLSLNEEQHKVRILLEGLSPQDRAVVVMRYWYDFSYEEIAASLSMTVSAVKSRLHRARLALAQSWQQQAPNVPVVERRTNEIKSPAY
jgi:RNA polymerase sigma-70 factor (ECF subfamily)